MADPIEFEFRVSGNAPGELRGMRSELQGVQGASDDAGSSWGNMSQKITAGILVFQQVTAAIKGTFSALRELGEEFDRQASIMNRFEGDISVARDRIGGLISDIDLMVGQQKLMNAGLQTSADDFATLAVAANEMAASVGGDPVQELQNLGQALTRGSRKLQEYGINVEGLTTIEEKQQAAMQQLREEFGNAESAADTLGGEFGRMDVALENLRSETIATVNDSRVLKEEWGRLSEAMAEVFGLEGLDMAEVFGTTITAMLTAIIRTITETIEGIGLLGNALDKLMSGDISGAVDVAAEGVNKLQMSVAVGIQRGVEAGAESILNRERRRIEEANRPETETRFTQSPNRGRGGRAKEQGDSRILDGGGFDLGQFAIREGLAGSTAFGRPGDRLGLAQAQIGSGGGKDAIREQEENLARMRAEQAREQEQRDREQLEREKEIAEQLREQVELRRRIVDAVSSGGKQILEFVGATQGQMELWEGASQVAKAIGAYPDFVGMAQHGLAATLHFANAARMGVSGGGDAKAQAASAPASPGNAGASQRPESASFGGAASSAGDRQPLNVQMHIYHPVDQSMAAMMIQRTQRAARSSEV